MKMLFVLAALAFGAASAQADPVINDPKAAKQLLGKHALTLQWIGTGGLKDAGRAEVKQENGEWRLTGRNDAKEGFVSLDGVVTKIDQTTFTFKGKIVTKVYHIFEGKECTREGEVTFERKGARKYWRMYPVENPCDAVADYIDIFLR
ncbi:hypothetical protein [Dongia sedimenti]|uniref:Uncharacterized protein n=1 Tax=Dongia sedimenti TaxID=3064282 RepID=A0ABU0YFF3_9PROT|nr:hypothetical protein [Rhodospirillaceae bacterium R-7]